LAILFFSQDTSYRLKNKKVIRNWIGDVIHHNNRQVGDINIIISNDDYLLKINQEYLQKDYLTDIIAFNYNFQELIQGDLFISHQRVGDNARQFSVSKNLEMKRVIIHGILHLLGWNDSTAVEKQAMHQKEDEYLKWLKDVGSL